MVPLVIPLVPMVMPMVPLALPMVPLALPMVPSATNGTIGKPMVPLVKLPLVPLGELRTEPLTPFLVATKLKRTGVHQVRDRQYSRACTLPGSVNWANVENSNAGSSINCLYISETRKFAMGSPL